ncbi:MAG: 3-dehydroquinate synthase, partial [Chroococcidiopsidaceae cyanobacterium CP_BM_ER_R8_30]|nr:3-dehydroquinate synthase [Chroococcidiopsidaceae cyanobacterium CP_BM_ER_R8_30]
MPSPIRVDLPQQSYDVKIADNGLQDLGHLMTSLELGKKVLVVSNPTIFR